MPHKVAICQYLDELTEEARLVGAVNTVILRDVDVDVDVEGGGSEGERDRLGESGVGVVGKGVGRKRKYIGTNTDDVGDREAFWRNIRDAETVRSVSFVKTNLISPFVQKLWPGHTTPRCLIASSIPCPRRQSSIHHSRLPPSTSA